MTASSLTFLISPALALRAGDGVLLAVAVVWGTSYGVAKGALAFYPVLGLLALRFAGAAAVLAWPAWRASSAAQRRAGLRAGGPLGLLVMAILLCETWGVAHTRASNAALLISLSVVFTPLLEWAWLGRRPTPALWACTAASLLGALLLAGGWNGRFGLGDGLVLAAAGLRALAVCATARWARGVPAPWLTGVQSAVVALGCVALALASGGLPPLPPLAGAGAFWGGVLYLTLGCTVFAFVAQNWALKHAAPSRVGLLMGSEPAWGALFAMLWLGERLDAAGWAGAALMLAAALLTLRARH